MINKKKNFIKSFFELYRNGICITIFVVLVGFVFPVIIGNVCEHYKLTSTSETLHFGNNICKYFTGLLVEMCFLLAVLGLFVILMNVCGLIKHAILNTISNQKLPITNEEIENKDFNNLREACEFFQKEFGVNHALWFEKPSYYFPFEYKHFEEYLSNVTQLLAGKGIPKCDVEKEQMGLKCSVDNKDLQVLDDFRYLR